MGSYDEHYEREKETFGAAYKEFEAFIQKQYKSGGTALDIGCGQGRDSIMLARNGFTVTAIDASAVGIRQMQAQAATESLSITGIVADFYNYQFDGTYDIVVLDSILHFEKNDRVKERDLLNRAKTFVKNGGILAIFVHKQKRPEKELQTWIESNKNELEILERGYVDQTYEEKTSGFKSVFQMAMTLLRIQGG